MTRHWVAPSVVPNWNETERRARRPAKRAYRNNADHTKRRDSVTAGEVAELMARWKR